MEYSELAPLLPDDFSDPTDTVAQVRAKFDEVHGHDPGDGVQIETASNGVWVRPIAGDETGGAIFFVHGGGFVTSRADTYTFYAANIARTCGLPVFVAEYRLAPETQHPGQTEDLLHAYGAVLETHRPETIVFMGDSCGGGMALTTIIAAIDRGLPLPGGFVSLCGWFDLAATGESAVNPVGRDPFLNVEWLRLRARDYVGPEVDHADPAVSPLYADLDGLPPMLLHAGSVDRCRSDAERLAERVVALGGEVQLKIWPGMPHGFHGLANVVPEADEALAEVAHTVRAWTTD